MVVVVYTLGSQSEVHVQWVYTPWEKCIIVCTPVFLAYKSSTFLCKPVQKDVTFQSFYMSLIFLLKEMGGVAQLLITALRVPCRFFACGGEGILNATNIFFR